VKTKPIVTLVGQDGNAFNILGLCQRAAKQAGWTQEHINDVMKEMKAGDYDHLLATAMKHFEVR
jgi:ERCC4-related helicase